MKLLVTLLGLLLVLPGAFAQNAPVTIPLPNATVAAPTPPPPTQVSEPVTLTITINGAQYQATATLNATVTNTGNQFQGTVVLPGTLTFTPAGSSTHTELPPPGFDPQPWLFIAGFSDMAGNSMPTQIKAGDRFMIEGHHFGDQTADCRVEVNTEKTNIISWLDTLIVAQAPAYPAPYHPADVLVWRSPKEYDLSMASFTVVPATP